MMKMFLVFLPVLQAYTGDVTVYSDDWHGGNCGYTSLWGGYSSSKAKNYFAAMNNEQWDDKMSCGRCVRLTCTSDECKRNGGKTTTVIITDRCPECVHGDIDLSQDAWDSVTKSNPSRLTISWEFITCPSDFVTSSIEYYIKDGSNRYWFAIQPKNTKQSVVKMEIKPSGASSWTVFSPPKTNNIDSLYFLVQIPGGIPSGEYQIRATSTNGQEITDTFTDVTAGETLYGSSQFESTRDTPVVSAPPEEPTPPPSKEEPTPPPSKDEPSEEEPSPSPTPSGSEEDESIEGHPAVPENQEGDAMEECGMTITHEVEDTSGGFSIKVFLTVEEEWSGEAWELDLRVDNVAMIDESWHASIEHEPERIVLKPMNGPGLSIGVHEYGFLGTKLDPYTPVHLTDATLQLYGPKSQTCTFDPSTQVLQQDDTTSSKATVPAAAVAVLAVSFSILLVISVIYLVQRRRQREPEIMTPCDPIRDSAVAPRVTSVEL